MPSRVFIFRFSSFIQQMLMSACLSEHSMSRMGAAEQSGTGPVLGACELVAGLGKSSLQDKQNVSEAVRESGIETLLIPSLPLPSGTFCFLAFSVPVVLLGSTGVGWGGGGGRW